MAIAYDSQSGVFNLFKLGYVGTQIYPSQAVHIYMYSQGD